MSSTKKKPKADFLQFYSGGSYTSAAMTTNSTTLEQRHASKAPVLAAIASDTTAGDIQAYQEKRKKTPLGSRIKKYGRFYCCTVHFDNIYVLITNKCPSLLHI